MSRYHTRGNRDQLNVIFNVLGTPAKGDVEQIEKEDAKRYVRIFQTREPTDLATRYPSSSRESVDLLKRMLIFNPSLRVTVDESLAHPFFMEVRNIGSETTAAHKISLPFDDWQTMDQNQLR